MKGQKNRFFTKTKNFSFLTIPLFFVISFTLVFFSKTDNYLVDKLKNSSVNIFTPISNAISSPIKFTISGVNYFNDLRSVKKENYKLKEEIIRLRKWQSLAIKNMRENNAYKKLLNSTSNKLELIKTASLISKSPNIYAKTIIINAGIDDKIENNLTAINQRGLVGRVISTNNNNSKVLLINDQNSSIPVKSIDRDFFAIVKGSSSGNFLISSFIKDSMKPKIGDVLVTSGNADIFPKDILVGQIIKIEKEKIIVLPYVDLKNIEFVQIIKNK